MEAAKAAIQKHISRSGRHTTEVDETVNPAVTNETIKPHRHEEATQAVDREVHQHHYHTTVQPIRHQETLPEKHTHNILPTERREYRHENDADTKERVSTELGRFKNVSNTHQIKHTQTQAPSVSGEHVHHHVHETVQPVLHKETIQPEVVHTTIPIHETHHVASEHHGMSALPMKTLDEFKTAGGVLSGGKYHSHEEYEGHPRPYNEKLATTFEKMGFGGSGAKAHRQTDSAIGMGSDQPRPTSSGSGVGNRDTTSTTTSTTRHNDVNQTSPTQERVG